MGGLASGADPAAGIRLELRGPSLGRFAPIASIGRWYRIEGCDAIVGAVCDRGAWIGELGLSLYLADQARPILPYTTVSLGRLFPDHEAETETWHPSIAAGLILHAQQTVGLVLELKYSHSTADPPTGPATIDTAGRLWVMGGVRLTF